MAATTATAARTPTIHGQRRRLRVARGSITGAAGSDTWQLASYAAISVPGMSLSEIYTPEVARWLQSLEERHLSDLRFAEVTRALRALSSGYVERRQTLGARTPFEGAGKRAAYALYYGPLHFLTVRAILHNLPQGSTPVAHLADWGCGTGAAGAAWATATRASFPHQRHRCASLGGPRSRRHVSNLRLARRRAAR